MLKADPYLERSMIIGQVIENMFVSYHKEYEAVVIF